MEFIQTLVDLFINLDKHLQEIISQYGVLTYLILFAVIFAETGFVFTPFLPGDSLLFAAGTLASLGEVLNIHLLFILLTVAAIIGDTVNYWIGHYFGMKLFHKYPKILKKEYLDKTHNFYEKYGGKTIIIARFVPIVRTFAPFVAGVGSMNYSKFITYNVVGAILWCSIFLYSGYYFGNLPFIRNNFSLVILVIILISILPGFIEYLRHRNDKKQELQK